MTSPSTIQLPPCIHCRKPSRRTNGAEIYPNRPDLAERVAYKCDPCGAYVGADSEGRPVGYPANAQLRAARKSLIAEVIEPLWKGAVEAGAYTPENDQAKTAIQMAARNRIYRFLGWIMGLTAYEAQVARFDLEDCRRAYWLLSKTTYPEIRKWAKARETKAQNEKETTHV